MIKSSCTGLNIAFKYKLLTFDFKSIVFRWIQFSTDRENIRSQNGELKKGVFRNHYIDSERKSKHRLEHIT